MDFTSLSFAKHRIFWSRVAVALAVVYILLVPPLSLLGPMLLESTEILGFFLLATAALGRLWCLAFIAGAKNQMLITEGPYSIVRNPLYVCNFLGVVGLGFAAENPPLALLLACGFVLFYPGVVRNEEARLERTFGAAYAAYCATTPALDAQLVRLSRTGDLADQPLSFQERAAWRHVVPLGLHALGDRRGISTGRVDPTVAIAP